MINLYSTGCPKCKILEMKLKQKNIRYNEISDLEKLKEKNILQVPVLEVDGEFYDFAKAVMFVNNFELQSNIENILTTNRSEDYGYRL